MIGIEKTHRELLQDVLYRVMREPCPIDLDGSISERHERRVNDRLAPYGMRVARGENGQRQNLLDTRSLLIEEIPKGAGHG